MTTQNDTTATAVAPTEEKFYTCFGGWEDDTLVIDFTVEGHQEDNRPDFIDGRQSFCAGDTAATPEAAEALVLAEYDGPQDDAEDARERTVFNARTRFDLHTADGEVESFTPGPLDLTVGLLMAADRAITDAYTASVEAYLAATADGNTLTRLIRHDAEGPRLLRTSGDPIRALGLSEASLKLIVEALGVYSIELAGNPDLDPAIGTLPDPATDQLASIDGQMELIKITEAQVRQTLDAPANRSHVILSAALKRDLTSSWARVLDAANGDSNDTELETYRETVEYAFGVLGIDEDDAEAAREE